MSVYFACLSLCVCVCVCVCVYAGECGVCVRKRVVLCGHANVSLLTVFSFFLTHTGHLPSPAQSNAVTTTPDAGRRGGGPWPLFHSEGNSFFVQTRPKVLCLESGV